MTGKTEKSWKKADDVIERTIDGEKVLLFLETGVYYSLNETGSFIWDSLEKAVTAGEIADELLRNFEGDRRTVLECVHELLADLESEKLVKNGD